MIAPPHPATAYPRATYEALRYDTSLLIVADGGYSRRAIEQAGGVFVPEVVAEFELGGQSSSYGDLRLVRDRLAKSRSHRETLQLLAKTGLWMLLPRRYFYRLLARGKYDRLRVGEPIAGLAG